MLKPFQALWNDVKGNASWDAIKAFVMYLIPIGSAGVGFDQWWKDAPPLEIATHFIIASQTRRNALIQLHVFEVMNYYSKGQSVLVDTQGTVVYVGGYKQ